MESLSGAVDVYFNLHRRVWSLRDRKSGLVTRHARVVVFSRGAEFVVQPAGRARVLRTGHKTVHAFVRGTDAEAGEDVKGWNEYAQRLPQQWRATYNPTRAGHFTYRDSHEPLSRAGSVIMIAPEGAAPMVWAI